MGTAIAGPATVTYPQAVEWARANGASSVFTDEMLPALWVEASRHGLDPAVVIAQSAHETGFGKFGRAVTPDHCNTAGIKIRNPGAYPDDAAAAHAQFGSWQEGARAHCQHLCAYVGLPIIDLLEHTPRAVWVRQANVSRGVVLHVEGLGGRWAPSSEYGHSVARLVAAIREA